MGERAMRPFWIHQAAEYLIGIALVAQGFRIPKPLVPCVVGTLVILNAAVVRRAAGRLQVVRARRCTSGSTSALMGVIAVAALNPWVETSPPPGAASCS